MQDQLQQHGNNVLGKYGIEPDRLELGNVLSGDGAFGLVRSGTLSGPSGSITTTKVSSTFKGQDATPSAYTILQSDQAGRYWHVYDGYPCTQAVTFQLEPPQLHMIVAENQSKALICCTKT